MARYATREDHPDCEGVAVVADDDPDIVVSCHDTVEEALTAIIALLDADDDEAEPPEEPAEMPAGGPPAAGVRFRSVLALADARTEDGRLMAELGVRDGQLPLAVQDQAQHSGFDPPGGVVGGTIESTRQIGRVVIGFGSFHPTEEGARAVELLEGNGGRFGVSVDLGEMDGDITMECMATGTTLDPFFGEEVEGCTDMLIVFPFARIAGATMTPIPAFAEACGERASHSELDDDAWAEQAAAAAEALNQQRDEDRRARLEQRGNTVVASAVPVVPPLAWFEQPEADGPEPLTIEPDGRVHGHLSTWGECHIGLPGCVTIDPSPSGYSLFHTGTIEATTPAGDVARIRGGRVCFRAEHADGYVSARTATAHYENTSLVAADVVARDGEFGIWLSGALRPGLDPPDRREVLAGAPSGDWRPIGGDLELVNVLLVNTPGFMGPHRASVRVFTSGASVTASGAVEPGRITAVHALGYGYPRQARTGASPVLERRLAALEQANAALWALVGNDAARTALALDVEGTRPLAPEVAAALRLAAGSAPAKGCGCGGTCGGCGGHA
jgi:hypothetical protein